MIRRFLSFWSNHFFPSKKSQLNNFQTLIVSKLFKMISFSFFFFFINVFYTATEVTPFVLRPLRLDLRNSKFTSRAQRKIKKAKIVTLSHLIQNISRAITCIDKYIKKLIMINVSEPLVLLWLFRIFWEKHSGIQKFFSWFLIYFEKKLAIR